MRMSQRALAAAAVIASVVAPIALAPTTASAAIVPPCFKISGEPKTIDLVVGSLTLDRVPNGADWSDCID